MTPSPPPPPPNVVANSMQAHSDYQKSLLDSFGLESTQAPPNEQSALGISHALALSHVRAELDTLAADNPALSGILNDVKQTVATQQSASADDGLSQVDLAAGNALVSHQAGRRLYADLTPTRAVFHDAITKHPIMQALAGAPLQDVTIAQCAAVCESLRRTDPPPPPPPLGDELFGNENTQFAAQKAAADALEQDSKESDEESHDEDANMCHSIAFRRRSPGDVFDDKVDCYLMHTLPVRAERSTLPRP